MKYPSTSTEFGEYFVSVTVFRPGKGVLIITVMDDGTVVTHKGDGDTLQGSLKLLGVEPDDL